MSLKKERLMKLAGLLKEQGMVGGGGSNGSPAPGHRAKMNMDMSHDEEIPESGDEGQDLDPSLNDLNEDSTLEYLSQGKSHRVDIYDARDELAALAYEIAGGLQGMHLDSSNRKTEKMLQNKLENIYKYLSRLKNLTN